MKDLVRIIAQALVDTPEEVSVREVNGRHTTVFELRVAKNDLGKVIGKQGRNAQAIRVILSAASAREHKRVVLEIIDLTTSKTQDHKLPQKKSASAPPRIIKPSKPNKRRTGRH